MTKLINELYISCYLIINWVVFKFINFNIIIIHIIFRLINIIKYLYIDMFKTQHVNTNYHSYLYPYSYVDRAQSHPHTIYEKLNKLNKIFYKLLINK